MGKELRVGVVVGRFQPLLQEQFEQLIKPAFEDTDLLIILLGSSDKARTPVDPFTAEQREEMFHAAFQDCFGVIPNGVVFIPVRDYLYSDTKWLTQVQAAVGECIDYHIDGKYSITLYGHGTKKYLNDFPQWDSKVFKSEKSYIDIQSEIVIKNFFYDMYGTIPPYNEKEVDWTEYVSEPIIKMMDQWIHSDEGQKMAEEFNYICEYIERTQVSKYPIIFQTVDNVVVYKGNILLVKRRSKPGKGLWALPGGFLNADESLLDGATRELQEETKLRVKKEWLKSQDTFDAPERSLRGRTITQAFLWQIPDWRNVPQIKAGSDAAKAKWIPLAKVTDEMANQLFEDHLDIIEALTKRL